MVKARIVGQPSRQNDSVVGTIRYLSDVDAVLGEYPFTIKFSEIIDLTTEQIEEKAIALIQSKLKQDKIEADWLKIQTLLAPLVIEEVEDE